MLPTSLSVQDLHTSVNINNSTPPPTTMYLNCIPISMSTPENYSLDISISPTCSPLTFPFHHTPQPLTNTYILHYLLATATPLWLFSLKMIQPCQEFNHKQHSTTLHKHTYNRKTLYKRNFTHFCMHLQDTRPTHNEVLI